MTKIQLCLTLIMLGIIGSVISLLIVPMAPMTMVCGLLLLIIGLMIYHKTESRMHQNLRLKAQDIHSTLASRLVMDRKLGFVLVLSGFVLAWAIAWFVILVYFRYSNFMFAIFI